MNVMDDLNIITYSIKEFFILLFALYIFMKIINVNRAMNLLIEAIIIIPISILTFYFSRMFNTLYCCIFQVISLILINCLFYKKGIGYTIINSIISLGVSYLILFISIILTAIISGIIMVKSDYVFLTILIAVYSFIVWRIFKIKKIKNGLAYLQKKIENEGMDLLLLNISMIILFTAMIIPGANLKSHVAVSFIMFALIMIITIKKSLDAYYKQTLLIQDLKDTKLKLEEKTKEIEKLEKENLEIGKRSHSLSHKQKILENKVNELILNSEIGQELTLKEEIEKISKEIYGNKMQAELEKTNITLLDDVLKCMQKECIEKNIDFELQVSGNLHYLINHYISEEELQILLADHIKDAIIAIEHSDNINRSILVKIGEFEGTYGLYIYDSGIEFEKEVLEILGKRPITTHKESGGTGMGFMNTFDTLKKHSASLIIKEIGPISETEYTKAIIVKFDGKGDFKIESYR